MKKKTRTHMLITLFLLVFLAGCAGPFTKVPVVKPRPKLYYKTVLPLSAIDEKTSYLKSLLESGELEGSDRELALDLLTNYQAIRDAVQEPANRAEREKVIRLLFANRSMVEKRYFSEKKKGTKEYPHVVNQFIASQKEIINKYLSGDYRGVIDLTIRLEKKFGPDSLTPEIGVLFARSLASKGMVKDAIGIGEKISKDLQGKPDFLSLQGNLIRWYLDAGDNQGARMSYKRLVNYFNEKEKALRIAKENISAHEKEISASTSVEEEGRISYSNEKTKPNSLKDILDEVNTLIEAHQFDRAKLLLIQQRIRAQEDSDKSLIDSALKSVDLAEEKFQKQMQASTDLKAQIIKDASDLIERENYEAAIAKLDSLSKVGVQGPETKKLRALAVEKLINRDRNRAAKLYLLAKHTREPSKKEELLLSSYQILKALLEKFPSTPLTDKIRDHIKKIEDELDKLPDGSG